MPSTFAIGDIHGNSAALADLLNRVREKLSVDDTVVFLGDYIDRGEDAKGCIDAIAALIDERPPGRTICLCGNHEDWMLKSRADHTQHSWWLSMEALATVNSYSGEAAERLRVEARQAGGALYEGGVSLPYDIFFASMPDRHSRFFDELALLHHDAHGIYSHAGIDQRVGDEAQTRTTLIWGWDDSGFPQTYDDTRPAVYGHRNDAVLDTAGWPFPRRYGNAIGLDTSRHGVISAIQLPDQRILQSRRFASTTAECP